MGKTISTAIDINRFFLSILLTTCIALILSFGAEIFGIRSCDLCRMQRFIYLCLFFISACGIFSNLKRFFLFSIGIFAFLGLLLSVYHLGVQNNVFYDACSVEIVKTIGELKSTMFSQKIPCSRVSLSLFGVPVTALNALICAIILTTFLRKESVLK